MWLKIGVILSIILFSSCSKDEKQTVDEKQETYNIPWEKDLNSALKKAKEENKKIMIMAIGKQCRWCNKIKKETLSKPKVLKELTAHYLLVKIDRGIPSQKSQIPMFEHVPAFFFATEEGKFYDELQGYFTTDEFLSAIKEVEELE